MANVALTKGDFQAALNFGNTGVSIARTPYDREFSNQARINALVLLKRPEGVPMLRDYVERCAANGWNTSLDVVEGIWGVALVMLGQIRTGIRSIERTILRCEHEGTRAYADLCIILLCYAYVEIIAGTEKPPAKVIARNILTLVAVTFTAQKRISTLIERVRQNPQFDPNGIHIGRCEMILGLLYKAKKKRALAIQHLIQAKRIASQFGPSLMLTTIDSALAELA